MRAAPPKSPSFGALEEAPKVQTTMLEHSMLKEAEAPTANRTSKATLQSGPAEPQPGFSEKELPQQSVTIQHGDAVIDLPVRGRVLKQDQANKVVSYSPDGRTCFQVEYVKDEGFRGEDGFRIEKSVNNVGEGAEAGLYYGWVKEGAFAQMDELKARHGSPRQDEEK